ncbi:MAG TPA: ABC transporter ATP-binding protein [Nocardioides sp.]|nr:ABC transporter ATP-binding protein [Nocardioides sp.]
MTRKQADEDDTRALFASGLTKVFKQRDGSGHVHALRGVDLEVAAGATVGLVGESGSGKTTFGRIAAGLTHPTGGRIELPGDPGGRGRWGRRRPSDVQMIFQDPRSSLDPRLPVAESIAEPLLARGLSAARNDVMSLIERVGLPGAIADQRPHELSGGQCQRVAIARAVAVRPKLIIADEPVSALDLSIQAQVLNLLKDLQEEFGTAVLLISHDLGVVRFFCADLYVLYLGQVVERGATEAVLRDPRHPYTEALASAAPSFSFGQETTRIVLAGDPPRPENPPTGCAFHTRCHRRIGQVCDDQAPLEWPTQTGSSRCHLLADSPAPQLESRLRLP